MAGGRRLETEGSFTCYEITESFWDSKDSNTGRKQDIQALKLQILLNGSSR